MRPSHRHCRRGITIIETVGVISAVGTLSLLSVMLLQQTFKTYENSLQHLQRIREFDQLVVRWREDVNRAQASDIKDGLTLAVVGGEQIVYTTKGNQVLRTRRIDGKQVGFESWNMPADVSLNWELDSSQPIQKVSGVLSFEGDSFQPIRMVARLGVAVELQAKPPGVKDA